MQASHSDKPTLLRRGIVVAVGLAILSGVEFWVAVGGLQGATSLLVIAALAKTALIVQYYMHAGSITSEGGH